MQIKEPALRPDWKEVQAFCKDHRSEERVKAHYVLEQRLANLLRSSPPANRVSIYSEVYGELFRSLPDHPQSVLKKSDRELRVSRQITRLMSDLGRDMTFLEIGCGDAVLSSALAAHVAQCYALDVTDALVDRSTVPSNLDILITNGTEIPLPQGSISVAFSDQLMEHLHPDDARLQLEAIFRVLKPGGIYHCITPNRVTGPHDISCYFDYEATGFHLREYDSSAILALFKEVGFRQVRFFVPIGRLKVPIPHVVMRAIESAFLSMPRRFRAWMARRRVARALAGLSVIGTK